MMGAIKDMHANHKDSIYTKTDGSKYSVDSAMLDKVMKNLVDAKTAMVDGDTERAFQLLNDVIADPTAPILSDDLMPATNNKLDVDTMLDLIRRTGEANKFTNTLIDLMGTVSKARQETGHAIRQQRVVDAIGEKSRGSAQDFGDFLANQSV